MSSVYAVVVTSNINDCLYVDAVEAYAGAQAALGSALRWAAKKTNNITFVDTSPEEEKMEDGSIRWIFLDTSKHFVGVIFTRIETALPAQNTRLDAVRSMPVVSVPVVPAPPAPPVYSLDDDTLPAGWFHDGKPARMKDLKEDPEGIKPIWDLNEEEKWALVIARVTKHLQFVQKSSGFTMVIEGALATLKARTPVGVSIRDKELAWLDDYLENLISSL